MAAKIIDLDGTIFEHGSAELLPGARDLLTAFVEHGDEIIFVTRRGDKEFKGHPYYSREAAQHAVDSIGIPYLALIFDVSSPRTVINDDGAYGHEHKTNGAWSAAEIEKVLALGFRRH